MSNSKQPWLEVWEPIKHLSKGGQGDATLVKEIQGKGRTGVLKALRNNKSKQARGRMQNEVSSLDSLSYLRVKVPAVYDSNVSRFKEEGVPLYFVMEYIQGETLEGLIAADGPLPLEKAAAMMIDLSGTIGLGHAEGVSHRDLKPANIMCRSAAPADLVVLDYGLSFNSAGAEDEGASLTVAGETFRNEFLSLGDTNTPGGDKRDPRSDVTALCAVFYFLLTGKIPGHLADGRGRPPHRRDGGHSVREHLAGDARCDQVESLFDRGFALDVDNRFQTCGEFTSRLALILRTSEVEDQDPKALAERLGQQLRVRDRKTQLADRKNESIQLVRLVAQKYGPITNAKIKPFSLSIQNHNTIQNHKTNQSKPFPDGCVPLGTGMTLSVSHEVHRDPMRIIVGFAAEGGQTVVLVHTAYAIPQKPESTTEWEKAMWFSPSNIPDESAIAKVLNKYLNRAMQNIHDTALEVDDAAPG